MGTYTEIEIIDSPSEVIAGQAATITVKTTNTCSNGLEIWTVVVATGENTGNYVRFINIQEVIAAGESKSYFGSFSMPDEGVDIGAYTYYFDMEGGHFDDETHTTIISLPVSPSIIVTMMPLVVLIMMVGMMVPIVKSFSKKAPGMLQAVSVAKVGNVYKGEAYGISYCIIADTERDAMEYLRNPLLAPMRYPPGWLEKDVVEELTSLGWSPSDPIIDRLAGWYLGLFLGEHFRSFKHSRLPGCKVGFDVEDGYITKSYLMRGFIRYG